MSGLLPSGLAQLADGGGWQDAAWVAVDLRLLLFLILIAALGSVGVCIIVIRQRRWLEFAAGFLVTFALLLTVLVVAFNGIAQYPVFVVESFFPFP